MPRRQTWLCALIIAVAALFLHHEVLWGGMVYDMDDAADGYYPSHIAAARAIRDGDLPTWERGSWSGWPQLADPYYAFFYPATTLFYLIGPVKGLAAVIVLHLLLAGFGTLWLGRRRGLEWGPALLAAVSVAFSSFMVVRIRHIIFPQFIAWIPILLASIEGWLTTGRRRDLAFTACACGMILLCGALPLAPYLAMLVGAYVLPRVLSRSNRERWRHAGGLSLAVAVGTLIAMAQIAPTLAHLSESPRSLGADYSFASTYAWPDVSYVATLVAPDLLGTETHWFGVYNHWEMAGYYAGALIVFLAPFGLLRRARAERWTLFAVALLGIGLAFGDRGPFHAVFFRYVPLYAALRCPTRALVMTLIALPILAADGLSWLSARAATSPRRNASSFTAAALLALAPVLWWRFTHLPPGSRPQDVQTALAVSHLMLVAAGGGAMLALLLGSWIPRRAGEFAIALIALADLLVVGRASVQPKPVDWAAGTERFAAVDWLLDHRPADRFAVDATGPFRLHNLGMTYSPTLEGVSGYDSFGIWRYVNFLWTVNTGAPYPHRTLQDDLAAGHLTRFDTPWVDFLNVRWAVAPSPPAADWIERFRPPPDAAPHARYEAAWDRALKIYENPHVLPRAFVVYRAVAIGTDDDQALALGRTDPRSIVILDRAPAPEPIGDGRPFTPAARVQMDRHTFTADVDTAAPGILVMSEPAYPGWSATVNGQPVPLLRANYAFRAVALSAGRSTVQLRFRSRPAETGIALSGAGLVGLVVLSSFRRRQPASSAQLHG